MINREDKKRILENKVGSEKNYTIVKPKVENKKGKRRRNLSLISDLLSIPTHSLVDLQVTLMFSILLHSPHQFLLDNY